MKNKSVLLKSLPDARTGLWWIPVSTGMGITELPAKDSDGYSSLAAKADNKLDYP